MNEILLTEDLRVLNGAVSHSGVPGMKWYQHLFGNWESHAKYAAGKRNPDAKDTKRDSKDKKNTQSKLSRPELNKYSDEELRRMTERLNLENNYQYAVQNAMRNEINYKRLQDEYRSTMRSPKKKSKSLAVFNQLSSKMTNAMTDVAADTGKKFLKAKTRQLIRNHNETLYKDMFQQDEQGKKDKNKKNND